MFAKTLFTVQGHHRNRFECCQAHLTDSTQLLQVKLCSDRRKTFLIFPAVFRHPLNFVSQELTWSHTHISNSVSSSSESVWPEVLLQSNIEQVLYALSGRQIAECLVYILRNPPGLKTSPCSLTRCRRVSCPWNNRPPRSRPTWRDL